MHLVAHGAASLACVLQPGGRQDLHRCGSGRCRSWSRVGSDLQPDSSAEGHRVDVADRWQGRGLVVAAVAVKIPLIGHDGGIGWRTGRARVEGDGSPTVPVYGPPASAISADSVIAVMAVVICSTAVDGSDAG